MKKQKDFHALPVRTFLSIEQVFFIVFYPLISLRGGGRNVFLLAGDPPTGNEGNVDAGGVLTGFLYRWMAQERDVYRMEALRQVMCKFMPREVRM
jgi:hypothetical protein